MKICCLLPESFHWAIREKSLKCTIQYDTMKLVIIWIGQFLTGLVFRCANAPVGRAHGC